jgi:class 3 adenylate cyclase
MFTDIVDSTQRAVELGDRQWRSLLDRHDETMRQQLVRFRGNEVKSLGDGFLATFGASPRSALRGSAIAETGRPLGIAVRSGLHTGEITTSVASRCTSRRRSRTSGVPTYSSPARSRS